MAAWEQGQAPFCPQPATLRSLLLHGKGLECSQGSLRSPFSPLPALQGSSPAFWGSPGTPTSAHPLHPPPLHHFALALASSSLGSPAQHGSSQPYPGDPTFPPVSGALPAQGFSWDVEEEEEGSRGSVCLLTPVCAAHHGQYTLLQPARGPGVDKEEEANPKLPWMFQEEATQNLNP